MFCVMEFKPVNTSDAVGIPYYRLGETLYAQTLQSLIGHKARFAFAWTIHGLKVVVMERNVTTGQVEFYKWPPGDDFFSYREHANAGITGRLLLQIARIALRGPRSSARTDVKENTPKGKTRVMRPHTIEKINRAAQKKKDGAKGHRDLTGSATKLFSSVDEAMWAWDVCRPGEKLIFTSLSIPLRFGTPESMNNLRMELAALAREEEDSLTQSSPILQENLSISCVFGR